MVETVDRHGLKRHYLRKHHLHVKRFYRQLGKNQCKGEPATKCKHRFEKNRDKLFTFLDYDGVPWNNNNAEHAIKAFARLRRVIEGLSTPKGIEEYLILLSVCQTCKYTGVDFLDFLRSGEQDIHAFAESRRRRRHGRDRSVAVAGMCRAVSFRPIFQSLKVEHEPDDFCDLRPAGAVQAVAITRVVMLAIIRREFVSVR
jgi:hypothetical protein